MTVTAEHGASDHTLSHPGEECVLVLDGQVRATLGSEVFELEQGDSLQYSSTLPHSYEVASGTQARLVIAMTVPVL
jgi:quercetin dioxygenase-like cupin family protein